MKKKIRFNDLHSLIDPRTHIHTHASTHARTLTHTCVCVYIYREKDNLSVYTYMCMCVCIYVEINRFSLYIHMRVCMKLQIIESCTYVYISIWVCLLCVHMNCSFPLLSRSSDLSVRDMDKSLQAEYYGKAWYWRRRCTPQRHLLLLLRCERTLWLG